MLLAHPKLCKVSIQGFNEVRAPLLYLGRILPSGWNTIIIQLDSIRLVANNKNVEGIVFYLRKATLSVVFSHAITSNRLLRTLS
jgi:hypothetical protein